MLNQSPYYHGIIKKTITAFGALFSDIKIERRQTDSVTGSVIQTLLIPISYAPKEKWLVRIDSDPTLENHTYTSLPRLSFEIINYSYDAVRKTNRMQKITCGSGSTTAVSMQSAIPYNVDIALYVLTKTQEDALQIIEQILPIFTPEYTLSINAIPSMNVVQDIPVILSSISVQDEYDGDFQMRRFVTHTLNFTLKINLFGPVSTNKVITTVFANINDSDSELPYAEYNAVGNSTTNTVTSEGWLEDL
jgi:hypothetical protein